MPSVTLPHGARLLRSPKEREVPLLQMRTGRKPVVSSDRELPRGVRVSGQAEERKVPLLQMWLYEARPTERELGPVQDSIFTAINRSICTESRL